MPVRLQVILICAAVALFAFMVSRARKNRMRTEYVVGWVICSLMLIVVAVFPEIAYRTAGLIGILSPSNMVFAFIILILLLLTYSLFTKVSALEEKTKNLTQEIALMREGAVK